ncbi:helix-turn-helix transcriptional regulator [Halomonas cibimaris]
MTRAEIWLQDTLCQPLSIDDLALHLGYSTSQVRRLFHHHFGSSPGTYRDGRRLERAAVLLALTLDPVADIGLACGYRNHSAFSRAFQRRYGTTPRRYRRRIRHALGQRPPGCRMPIHREKKRSHYAIMRREYKPPHALALGSQTLHAQGLGGQGERLSAAVPGIALPDLFTARLVPDSAFNTARRTDVGLCLLPPSAVNGLALPMPYRCVPVAAQHYATVRLSTLHQLDGAVDCLIHELMRRSSSLRISGKSPSVLWLGHELELRVPLVAQPDVAQSTSNSR